MFMFSSQSQNRPGKCAFWLAVLVFFSWGGGSARAAELAGGTLTVVRDTETADCPDESALASATLALGTPPADRAEGVTVNVVFQKDAFGYGALVTTTGNEGGLREVRKPGPTCAALAEAVSVVLAVVFDLAPREEGAVPEAPRPAPPVVVAPAAPPRVDTPPPARPRPPSRSARGPELGFGVGAHGAVSYGLLGAAAAGAVSGALRPSLGRWELGVGVLGAPNRAATYIERTVYVSMVAGRLTGCGWLFPSRSRPDVGLCAGLLLGRLRARGDGFDEDAPPVSNAWLAFEGGAAARFPVTPNFALRLGISLLVPSRRQTFTVTRAGRPEAAFRSTAAAGLLELGPELRFP